MPSKFFHTEIMENRDKGSNITIVRIKEILKIKYNINLSNSSIYRIIKNKLKYKFRKTLIKNIDLNKTKYKIMSVGDAAQAVVNLTMRMKSKVRIPQREELLFRAKGFWLAEAKPMDHELR